MAKTVVVFDAAVGALGKGSINLSDTYRCYLMSAGWSPDYNTSTFASLTAQFCTQLSGNFSEGRSLGLCDWTRTAAGVWRFTPATDPLTFCASSGTNLSAQYAAVVASGGSIPLCYWEISTAEVVASRIILDFPADGLFDSSAVDKTV